MRVQSNGAYAPDLLLCENNQAVSSGLLQAVRSWGFHAEAVQKGEEAWDFFTRPGSPRLAVLGWRLTGISGLDLCRRIKHTPSLPYVYVILLAANHDRKDLISGLEAGADEILTVPVHLEELKRHLIVGQRIIQAMPPHPPMLEEPIVPGYEVGPPLGKGALGVVYKAKRLTTGHEVALKVIRMDKLDRHSVARFIREIEITSRLRHPNLVRVLDARMDIGLYYYAMELISGPDLASYIVRHQPSQIKLLTMMADVCAGLAHAHQRGIIHRDLKFTNIVVDQNDVPKLVDFGFGKAVHEKDEDLNITRDGYVVGTPAFMSPEQADFRTEQIGPHSDVYAVGVMLYRLILGRHPHRLEPPVRAMMRRIVEEEIYPPRTFSPNIHHKLEALLLKALAKDPAQRYPDAGHLASALHDLIHTVVEEQSRHGLVDSGQVPVGTQAVSESRKQVPVAV